MVVADYVTASFLLVLWCSVAQVAFSASCAYSSTTLTKWSTVPAWNVAYANVTIEAGQQVLLDISPPQLGSINIKGTLYVAENLASLNVSMKFINIYPFGAFYIGSSACPIAYKAVFTFVGPRNNVNQTDMGFDAGDGGKLGCKGLAVQTNGTFSVYGKINLPSWTNLAQIAYTSSNTLVMRENVNWQKGDNLVVASTDYSELIPKSVYVYDSVGWQIGNSPDQNEVVTVSSVVGNVVTLTSPLKYTHWAGHYQYAEVGLLTRYVLFQGDNQSLAEEYGGHILMRRSNIHIEGLEVQRMGQKGVLGRYPFHFHMMRNVSDLSPIIRHTSHHDNFQRGVSIHESHGVTLADMVGYKTFGHMYFLEDGGERNNTLDHNLGIVAYPVPSEEIKYGIQTQLIPTDDEASILWLSNPNNYIRNNAFVGGKFGIWSQALEMVTGASAGLYTSAYKPRWQTSLQFENNTAHSSNKICFFQENTAGVVLWNTTTVYKCRNQGIWSNSGDHRGVVLADVPVGLFLVANVLYNSVLVGQSANLGLSSTSNYICGFNTYDKGGGHEAYGNLYINYTTTSSVSMGGNCGGGPGVRPRVRAFNNTYINANPYINRQSIGGGFHWLDVDGTSTPNSPPLGSFFVQKTSNPSITALPLPKNTTGCVYNSSMTGWYCPMDLDNYFLFKFADWTLAHQFTPYDLTLLNGTIIPGNTNNQLRYKLYDAQRPEIWDYFQTYGNYGDCTAFANNCEGYYYNMAPRRMVSVRFLANSESIFRVTPSSMSFNAWGGAPGDWMYINVLFPAATNFTVVSASSYVPYIRVYSWSEMTQPNYYYFDSATERLWVMIKSSNYYGNSTDYYRYGIVDEVYTATNVVLITANCTLCAPSSKSLTNVSPAPAVPFKEYIFTGTFTASQVVPAVGLAYGVGNIKVWYYPHWNEIQFSIIHNLTVYQPTIEIGSGAAGKFVSIFNYPLPGSSPSRGSFIATAGLLSLLYSKSLFVQIYTPLFPNGHLRAQLTCQGTCGSVTVNKATAPCTVPPYAVPISFANTNTSAPWYLNSGSTNNNNITNNGVCGQTSMTVSMCYSQFEYRTTKGGVTVNATNFLEFSILMSSSNLQQTQNLFVTTTTSSYTSPRLYISNYVVDGILDNSNGWQHVAIPFSDFNFADGYVLSKVIFGIQPVCAAFALDRILVTRDRTTVMSQVLLS